MKDVMMPIAKLLKPIAIRLTTGQPYESLIDLSSVLRYPAVRNTSTSCKIVKNQPSMTAEVTGVSFVLDSTELQL